MGTIVSKQTEEVKLSAGEHLVLQANFMGYEFPMYRVTVVAQHEDGVKMKVDTLGYVKR